MAFNWINKYVFIAKTNKKKKTTFFGQFFFVKIIFLSKKGDGDIYSWGAGGYGQLGHLNKSQLETIITTPVLVISLDFFFPGKTEENYPIYFYLFYFRLGSFSEFREIHTNLCGRQFFSGN